MHTRACTAGLRPKQTCSNISASAHLQSTKWCLRSNAQGSSADSAASLAVSKCSLIQNTCRSYDEPRSTSQNLCAEVLAQFSSASPPIPLVPAKAGPSAWLFWIPAFAGIQKSQALGPAFAGTSGIGGDAEENCASTSAQRF